eukprot:gene20445-22461_t
MNTLIQSRSIFNGSILKGLGTVKSCAQKSFAKSIATSSICSTFYITRTYLKKWARRDMKRRKLFAEYEPQRNALRALKKSDILPDAVKMQAGEDLDKLPRDSCITRMRDRCTLTDRPRAIQLRYRISRIKFRDFADKGLISGITKSVW